MVGKITAKQNYPGSVASYDTRPGNVVGLFYDAPKPTLGAVMPATHTQETCTRNCYKSFCTRNSHVGRSILYKLFLVQVSCTQLSTAQKLSGAWHKPCNVIGRRIVLVQETVMNLRQIFRASFWYQFLERVSLALDSRNTQTDETQTYRYISYILCLRIFSHLLNQGNTGVCLFQCVLFYIFFTGYCVLD